ncbi:MAG: hypothetical protein J5814_06935 [Bacteroidaceae bacterium]|nr:hypothetical protein [Bacteroidaceae bacterium]
MRKVLFIIVLFAASAMQAEDFKPIVDGVIMHFNQPFITPKGVRAQYIEMDFRDCSGYKPSAQVFCLRYGEKNYYGIMSKNNKILYEPIFDEYFEFKAAKVHIMVKDDLYTVIGFNRKLLAKAQEDIELDNKNHMIIGIGKDGTRTYIPWQDD